MCAHIHSLFVVRNASAKNACILSSERNFNFPIERSSTYQRKQIGSLEGIRIQPVNPVVRKVNLYEAIPLGARFEKSVLNVLKFVVRKLERSQLCETPSFCSVAMTAKRASSDSSNLVVTQ